MKLCSGFEKKHKKPPFLPFLALFSKFTFLAITPEEEFVPKCGFTITSPLKAFYLKQKKQNNSTTQMGEIFERLSRNVNLVPFGTGFSASIFGVIRVNRFEI